MELSIVTGTYNRLLSLQRMIESARRSMAGFMSYEFVVVDGGSTDGTLEWCKSQRDINLIEQGALLGAVKAFNAGAMTSIGRFVILANDDITFDGDSILYALTYMYDTPTCGMGCFYQDRDDMPFHVSRMKAVAPNGIAVSVYYGQVCIVPREVGDELGWWGDYLHTYGGDNELSCNMWEYGLTVDAIDCACILDGRLEDELRVINNSVKVESGRHPDTDAWVKKWPHGPHISQERKMRQEPRRLRVMYLPVFEPGNNLQKLTKRGLSEAMEKQLGPVLQFDYIGRSVEELFETAEAYQPDIFMFQLQDANKINHMVLGRLREKYPYARFINWNGDYHPENLFHPAYIRTLQQFDLVGVVTTQVNSVYRMNHINVWYWQIGYEESDAEPDSTTPKYDVVFLGNGYNAARIVLGQFLLGLRKKGWDVGIYGNWNDFKPNGANLYNFDQGQKLYRNSTFAISTQEYPAGTGFVSNRLFQALAAGGCVVLQQRFPEMEILGLEDGVHYVVWDDYEHLEHILDKLDGDEFTCRTISEQGTEYVHENYSFDAQVRKLVQKLQQDKLL